MQITGYAEGQLNRALLYSKPLHTSGVKIAEDFCRSSVYMKIFIGSPQQQVLSASESERTCREWAALHQTSSKFYGGGVQYHIESNCQQDCQAA